MRRETRRASADDHPGDRGCDSGGSHGSGPTGRHIPARSRFCRLARVHPGSALERGEGRLGKTSKMGERSLRRLLIIGASAVARWAARKGVPAGSWLGRMLARKPPMLVRVALANKMARIVWALLARGGVYRAPVAAV